MADPSKQRVLTVVCKGCGQMIPIFKLSPYAKLSGDPKLTKFNVKCPHCSKKRDYPFEATFEYEA
jgi:endogenous inhibitor of DNA gyrase (YacG/DUF329 family)